jgi:hypothetical protein
MPSTYGSQGAASSFVPTTDILDASTIQTLDLKSEDFKIFLVRLQQRMNDIAISLNGRDAGVYFEVEFINGQVYFANPALNATTPATPVNRQVFRKVVNVGALLDTATKQTPHGISIDPTFSFTRIYATASDPAGVIFLPIPYVSGTAGDEIEIWVDGTNVNIKTGKDRRALTICYAVLEYIKQ